MLSMIEKVERVLHWLNVEEETLEVEPVDCYDDGEPRWEARAGNLVDCASCPMAAIAKLSNLIK